MNLIASNHSRGFAALSAIGLLALLVTAAILRPDPSGSGTHRQLGLPPCSMKILLGVPCPACGMTTSWSYFGRANWGAAAGANAGGLMLAMVACAAAVQLIWYAVRGQPVSMRAQWSLLGSLLAAVVVAVAQWGWRIGSGP